MRRVLLASGGCLLALPASAAAHGLIQRADLPIPEWLFGWAAAIVLVVSFAALAVLWPKPKLEDDDWRPLPGGAALGSRPVEWVCGALGLVGLVVVLLAGYLGPPGKQDNLAPTAVLVVFWVGFVFISVLFGDVYRAFNPYRALGRALRLRGLRPYPERLGRWPATVGLFGFTWFELVLFESAQTSQSVAHFLAVYSVAMLAGTVLYGAEDWSTRGDAFGVYFGIFGRLAPFATRERVVGVRRPLSGLTQLETWPGTVALLCVMIGTVTYDGLSQGAIWKDIEPDLSAIWTGMGMALVDAIRLSSTIGLLACCLLVALFYRLGIAGARSVGGTIDAARLRIGFIHSLVPIAVVYVAAHYLTYLLFQGQALAYLTPDPFGQGWNLPVGSKDAGIDYSLISQNATWYLQVGFVVAGHVAALVLAHDRALVLYGQARLAVRSQYWMLGIMVGFTTLALWLLAQAGA